MIKRFELDEEYSIYSMPLEWDRFTGLGERIFFLGLLYRVRADLSPSWQRNVCCSWEGPDRARTMLC